MELRLEPLDILTAVNVNGDSGGESPRNSVPSAGVGLEAEAQPSLLAVACLWNGPEVGGALQVHLWKFLELATRHCDKNSISG